MCVGVCRFCRCVRRVMRTNSLWYIYKCYVIDEMSMCLLTLWSPQSFMWWEREINWFESTQYEQERVRERTQTISKERKTSQCRAYVRIPWQKFGKFSYNPLHLIVCTNEMLRIYTSYVLRVLPCSLCSFYRQKRTSRSQSQQSIHRRATRKSEWVL